MKFLPGRIAWGGVPQARDDARDDVWELHGDEARGAWRALLPLRMKILPGRTALKTLDTMALCTARCLPPFLGNY